MTRTRAPRGEGDRLHDELLDAAEALLNETGDERAVTIRAIVDRVGVTPPSLYRHFDSKEALIHQAVARRFGALARAIGEGAGPPAARGDAAGALRGGCLGYLRWARQEPGGYALLFSDRRDTRIADGPSGTAAFDALAGGIAGCQQARVARDGDPQRMAMMVWAGLHGLASLTIARPHIDWPPLEQLVDDLLIGQVGLVRGPDEPEQTDTRN